MKFDKIYWWEKQKYCQKSIKKIVKKTKICYYKIEEKEIEMEEDKNKLEQQKNTSSSI